MIVICIPSISIYLKYFLNKKSIVTNPQNLLICGSGAHPGGGVMGAPGRIAAQHAVQLLGAKWMHSQNNDCII